MVDRVSAFAGHYPTGHRGVADKTGITLKEVSNLQLHQIAAWPDTLNNVGQSAADMACLLYTSPSPRDQRGSRMPSSA